MSIATVADFETKDGQAENLTNMLKGAMESVRGSEGNLEANVYVDQDNPNWVRLIEKWESADNQLAHMAELDKAGVLAKVGEMCTRRPIIWYLDKLT